MREIIARLVCGLTLMVVVGLSFLFAAAHNRPAVAAPAVAASLPTKAKPDAGSVGTRARADAKTAAPIESAAAPVAGPESSAAKAQIERGRTVYSDQKCATCHSVAGSGNPRNPLDGAGQRWDAAELRAWITGTGVATELLQPAIAKRKQRFQQLPEPDLAALVAYVASLPPAK